MQIHRKEFKVDVNTTVSWVMDNINGFILDIGKEKVVNICEYKYQVQNDNVMSIVVYYWGPYA